MRGQRCFPWSVVALVAVGLIALTGCSGGGNNDNNGGGGGPLPGVHANVAMMDVLGNPITAGSSVPYSPRQTCGVVGCHDVDAISNAYHFEQGRTDLQGNIITQPDYFNDGRTFVSSAGMYGKW